MKNINIGWKKLHQSSSTHNS